MGKKFYRIDDLPKKVQDQLKQPEGCTTDWLGLNGVNRKMIRKVKDVVFEGHHIDKSGTYHCTWKYDPIRSDLMRKGLWKEEKAPHDPLTEVINPDMAVINPVQELVEPNDNGNPA